MELWTSFLVAVGLAMDALAVSLGAGCSGQVDDRPSMLRMSFSFGFFQTLMTVLGWLAGSSVARFIEGIDHWIAMALLGYVAFHMIRSGLDHGSQSYSSNPSRGRTLVLLSIATSIDAMAVGLSMAMLKTPVLIPSLIIGVVTFGLSIFGLLMGKTLGDRFGKRMEILGGLILLGIGIQVVINHLS